MEDVANCMRAIAPDHCFSAFCKALMSEGLAGVEVLMGSNRGEAGHRGLVAIIRTVGLIILGHFLGLTGSLVRASRNHRLFGFSGRRGVSVREEQLTLRSLLESRVLFSLQSCSMDSYPEEMLTRSDGLSENSLVGRGDHSRGVQPNVDGSTASHSLR